MNLTYLINQKKLITDLKNPMNDNFIELEIIVQIRETFFIFKTGKR